MEHTVQKATSRKGKGGPKTAEGKAKSALNAVTHGLTAQQPVALWFEQEEAWAAFRAGIVASLSPVGEGEKDLAEKIALILWRQNRVAAYETHRTNLALHATPGEVERNLRPDHTEADTETRMRAKLTERLLLPDLELQKLQRYESHLGRELSRLFKHLHQLQDRRQAAHPASPAAPSSGTHTGNALPSPVTQPSAAPLAAASVVQRPIHPAPFLPVTGDVASIPAAPGHLQPFCKTNSGPWPHRQVTPFAPDTQPRSLHGGREESGARAGRCRWPS